MSAEASIEELPENARRYLTFIQLQLGSYPITAVTTGPDTANFIDFSAGQ